MKFKKGETNHIIMGPGKPYKIYILAIIETDMIVYRWYGRHKQWWHYVIEHETTLEMRIKMVKERKSK